MASPADNAATVRRVKFVGTEKQCMDAVAALDALLAQAEAAERTLELADEDHDIIVAHLEAERDAAEEKNKKLSALIVEQERQYGAERDAAVRAAEQAQDALRLILSGCELARPDLKPELTRIAGVARTALTGEETA